jgi:hypothetical protein
MRGSEYLLCSYGQFEKMTFFSPDPLPKRKALRYNYGSASRHSGRSPKGNGYQNPRTTEE